MGHVTIEEVSAVIDRIQLNASQSGLNAIIRHGVGEYELFFHTFSKSYELEPNVFVADEVHKEMAAVIYLLKERLLRGGNG